MTKEKIEALELPMMVENNTSKFETGFTVSIEARCGVSTGISAADRAATILTAVADDARPSDLVRPGHIFPLKARTGGVIVRAGQTEGSVDLARLAGMKPAAVICEIMDDDGTMARMPSLEEFSETQRHRHLHDRRSDRIPDADGIVCAQGRRNRHPHGDCRRFQGDRL